jgi:hypothetical protein
MKMQAEPDITVTVNFHSEGALALSALASLGDLVKVARAAALVVETQAILDRADELTRHIVDVWGRWIDTVEEVSFGDLGLSRNAGTRLAHGRFLSFLDGDDLWGEQWLSAAFGEATESAAPPDTIWHPEHQYIFSEAEFGEMSGGSIETVHKIMQSSDTSGFDPALLVFQNIWSANAFARRELYVRFPYCAVDRDQGVGIEDWSWNLATLAGGVHHRVVPGAVHLIRKKSNGSLDRENMANQLLPRIPPSPPWSPK